MTLPADFTARMKKELGSEYDAFIAEYDKQPLHGLRANTLKITPHELSELTGFCGEPVPWCESGFYYDGKKGGHAASAAGLFYSQEPSAQAAAGLLGVHRGDKVLDLCAAPGGKSTQIACALGGSGMLVSNEITAQRAKILCENVERMGITNAVVTNMRPDALEKHFKGFFDRIIVDAPCSGEGMFRKDAEAIAHWSLEHTYACAQRQKKILRSAFEMLCGGGTLVYSTCTFSREENEEVCTEFSKGFPCMKLKKTVRIMPHREKGEGHFAAEFVKEEETGKINIGCPQSADKEAEKIYRAFERENLNVCLEGRFVSFGEKLYLSPQSMPELRGIKCLRPGILLGEIRKGRLVPAHHLCMCLKAEDFKRTASLTEDELCAYRRGESVFRTCENGFGAALYSGKYPVGWFKSSNGQLKNHYPKYLRG